MALLIGIKGKVAESALMTLVVLTAGMLAVLALAMLAIGIVTAVPGEAATAATAGGGTVLMLGRIKIDKHLLVDGKDAFLGSDLVSVLVIVLNGHHNVLSSIHL